jgi:membrane-associated phospholipid phosphatase
MGGTVELAGSEPGYAAAPVEHRGWAVHAIVACALLAAVSLLVQLRLLANWDEAALQWIVTHRPAGTSEVMNWVFRLGFLQVDAVVSVIWAAWGLIGSEARSRSRGRSEASSRGGSWTFPQPRMVALAPLMIFVAIGLQAGLRLVVDQPAPSAAYELRREFSSEPVGLTLDRTDAATRGVFAAATASQAAVPPAPRSYPSGHASRVLFLSLLAARTVRGRGKVSRVTRVAIALLPTALVGYSALYFGYHWPSDLLGGALLALVVYAAVRRFAVGVTTPARSCILL